MGVTGEGVPSEVNKEEKLLKNHHSSLDTMHEERWRLRPFSLRENTQSATKEQKSKALKRGPVKE